MKPNIQKLIENFSSFDNSKKIESLAQITAQKDPAILQFLVNCLGDESWATRKIAAEKIKEYGEPAISVLSVALNSYNEDIQHWSLQILGELGPKGVPAILRAMKSNNDEIRFFACKALGKSRSSQGVTALLRGLGDSKWRVRKSASDALIKYGEVIISPLQQVLGVTKDEDIRFWAIKTLGKLGPKAQKFLLEALRNGDKKTRYVIAAALGESGDRRVIKVLIESLADPDWTIRKSATMALAEIGNNAVDMMMEYLKGPNEEVRDGCLRALVKSGNRGLQRLFDEICKMDDNQRFLIRKSIVKIGSRVVEPLMRLFNLENPEILSFAASALGEIGNPRAVPVLIQALSSEDWNVRRSSAYALTEIGESGVDKIAEALESTNDDVRYWVTRILESIGEPGVPYLVKALSDDNREIRFFAAKALGSAFDASVARSLIFSLGDKVWSVRKVASESICRLENLCIDDLLRHISSDNEDIRYWIGRILSEIGIKHLNRIIETMRKGDPELRLYACQAAGLIESNDLVEPLIDALRDDSEWVRTYAAISLGRTGDPRAIIPLIRSFSDRNSEVHRNILVAFEKIGDKVFNELIKCIEGNDPDLRCNAATAISEMHETRGVDYLVLLMEDSDMRVRQAAAEALGHFPGLKSRTMLFEGLEDKELKVRIAVIRAIGKLNEPQGILKLIEHISTEKDERETRTAQRMLAVMAEEKTEQFINLFAHEQNSIRGMALDALVSAGIEVLAQLTQVAAESEDETIVFWCKKAIKQIKEPRESMFSA